MLKITLIQISNTNLHQINFFDRFNYCSMPTFSCNMNAIMHSKPIVIVGSVALDTIEFGSDRYCELLGGAATYATIAAGRYTNVSPVGIVGEDFPVRGLQLFKKYSANLTDLKTVSGSTFRWGGRYHASGKERDTLFTELGVFENFSPQLSEANRNAQYLFLANIHPGLQRSVIEQMESNPTIVTDTMNLWINTTRDDLLRVIKKTSILLINESESQLLTGQKNLRKASQKLLEFGLQALVIKRGAAGAILYSEKETISIDAFPVAVVVDPTGAGDSFGGGFISALAEGLSSKDGLIRGSALASTCVEGVGTAALESVSQTELINREQVLRHSLKPWKD